MNLMGKCALVPGGSRGIGVATAKASTGNKGDVSTTFRSSAKPANSIMALIEKRGRRGLATTAYSGPEHVKQARQVLRLLMETEQTIYRDPDIASTYLAQALALLVVDNKGDLAPCKHRGGLARWQVSRIDTFINEHIDQYIRTTELASVLGFSVGHFSHAFKQTTGMTPLMYVAAARVQAAQKHMLCSARSLSDIAHSHGFCDQSHFCRVFRRETGLSPQAWRKLHTANTPSPTVLTCASSSQPARVTVSSQLRAVVP